MLRLGRKLLNQSICLHWYKIDQKERTYDHTGSPHSAPTSQGSAYLSHGWAMAKPYEQLKIKPLESYIYQFREILSASILVFAFQCNQSTLRRRSAWNKIVSKIHKIIPYPQVQEYYPQDWGEIVSINKIDNLNWNPLIATKPGLVAHWQERIILCRQQRRMKMKVTIRIEASSIDSHNKDCRWNDIEKRRQTTNELDPPTYLFVHERGEL